MIIKFFGKTFRKKKKLSAEKIDIPAVEKIVGHRFRDQKLLAESFKHRSYLIINNEPTKNSNERLEFLGDAVLDLVVTDYLYKLFPDRSEGFLSKIKSVLVSRKVLAQIVSDLKLGKYLLLNRGEESSGGRKRMSNLANLYEAILGAIYLDGGLKAARDFTFRTLLHEQDRFLSAEDHVNFKSILLEFAQGKGWDSPQYKLVSESGPDHEKIFEISVNLHNLGKASGIGKSKKIAEQNAAQKLLEKIAPELIENSFSGLTE